MRILLYFLILFTSSLLAQSFSKVPDYLPNTYNGSLEWGDYDKDGDYDFLITGDSTGGNTLFTAIYSQQSNGTYAPLVSTGLPDIRNSDAAWSDYDNDGDLDIALSGLNKSSEPISRIYENDGNQHFKINPKAILFDCFNSNLAWGDYNTDGKPDLLLTGNDNNMAAITRIYTNKGNGVFSELNVNVQGVSQAAINWVDFDGDGKLDVYVSGLYGNTAVTKLYKGNGEGGFFEILAHGIVGTISGSSDWGDYDSDGDLDLITTGGFFNSSTRVYNNDKGIFTEIHTTLEKVGEGSAGLWGDYNQDGYLDIILTGRKDPYTELEFATKLYKNLGNGQFVGDATNLPLFSSGNTKWIDLDKDGDLDLSFYGISNRKISSQCWLNTSVNGNRGPNVPSNLSASRSGNQVTFSWKKTTDNTTASKSITYNIRIGTFAGKQDIVNSYSSVSTGSRWLSNRGNVGLDTSFVLTTSFGGPFYWSVQAIDNSLTPSAFASEKVYDGVVTLLEEEAAEKEAFYVRGKKEAFQFSLVNSFLGNVEARIIDLNGRVVHTSNLQKASESLSADYDLSAYCSGMYLLQVTMGNEFKRHTFFLE